MRPGERYRDRAFVIGIRAEHVALGGLDLHVHSALADGTWLAVHDGVAVDDLETDQSWACRCAALLPRYQR